MDGLKAKAAELVEEFILETVECGLTWDEAVVVFALAAKAAAQAAFANGEGTAEACMSYARTCLDEAFAVNIQVTAVDADSGGSEEVSDDNALLAIARRRPLHKLH